MIRGNFGRKSAPKPGGRNPPQGAPARAPSGGGVTLSANLVRINLLPHRELKRAARQQQFNFLAGGTVVLALLIVFLVHTIISGRIDGQNYRNTYLEAETAKLDKEIDEIKKIKEQIQAMLERKKVVEALQSNRSQTVLLLDQLVRQLPDGVYLKAIKQTGTLVNLQGYAQSNARVATLIRNLEASPWLELPELVETKATTINNLRLSEFSLNIRQTQPKSAAEEGKGAPVPKKQDKPS